MAREFFSIEKGLHKTGENTDAGVYDLFGSANPGLLSQENNAEVGSQYQNTSDGSLWQKYLAGSGQDKWQRLLTVNDQNANIWYKSAVKAATADAAPSEGGTIDLGAAPFSDDDAPTLAGSDFAVGDYVLFDCDGTPTMTRVTGIAVDVLTFTLDALHATYPVDPIGEGDMIAVTYNLPDGPDAQEKEAILQYSGGICRKIGDFNWELATGISLTSGYGSSCGTIAASDTLEVAISKADGDLSSLNGALGITKCDGDMGAYTGTLINDDESAKENIQQLETYVEHNVWIPTSANAVEDTPTTLDSVKVDDFCMSKWMVCITEDGTTNRWTLMIDASHNGTATTDATLVSDDIYSKRNHGSSFTYSVGVDLDGAGAAQVMRLRVEGDSGAAVSFKAKRVAV